MKQIVLAILLFIPVLISAQNLYDVFPIATDSTINEVNPYLTKYWYDGWNSYGNIASVQEKRSPLWLTFVETNSSNLYKVVAYNFSFDYKKNISISEKYIIADSNNGSIKRTPLIENYMGKPVAIWTEGSKHQNNLYFSVFDDSLWNTPQKITNDSSFYYNPIFITVDSWNLNEQDNPFNYLIWTNNNNIVSAKLDSNFNWSKKETLYKSEHSVSDVNLRRASNGDLWMVFCEGLRNDSTNIFAFVQSKDSTQWNGPYLLKEAKGTFLQCEINTVEDYYRGNTISVTWIESGTVLGSRIFKEQKISFKNDSLKFVETESDLMEFGYGTNYTSNTLSSGGCVIGPTPFYFRVNTENGKSKLNLCYEDITGDYREWDGGYVSELTMSGLNKQFFMVSWVEVSNSNTDIFLAFDFISMGDVINRKNNKNYILEQNYPNPFNPSTTIKYSIPNVERMRATTAQLVTLKVYDILGREVATLVNKEQKAGNYEVKFNAEMLNSGIYFYQLRSGKYSVTKKMLLLK